LYRPVPSASPDVPLYKPTAIRGVDRPEVP
jgi:hypothetical protein